MSKVGLETRQSWMMLSGITWNEDHESGRASQDLRLPTWIRRHLVTALPEGHKNTGLWSAGNWSPDRGLGVMAVSDFGTRADQLIAASNVTCSSRGALAVFVCCGSGLNGRNCRGKGLQLIIGKIGRNITRLAELMSDAIHWSVAMDTAAGGLGCTKLKHVGKYRPACQPRLHQTGLR